MMSTKLVVPRRVAFSVLVVLAGISGTAWAWFESGVVAKSAAYLPGNAVPPLKVGCVGRMQVFEHGGDNDKGTVGLRMDAWNATCSQRTPGNAISRNTHRPKSGTQRNR